MWCRVAPGDSLACCALTRNRQIETFISWQFCPAAERDSPQLNRIKYSFVVSICRRIIRGLKYITALSASLKCREYIYKITGTSRQERKSLCAANQGDI